MHNAIYNKIQGCHVVLVPTSISSTYSKWINKEIKIAREGFIVGSKPIIGINPLGQENISSIVRENANEIVKWRSDSIINAIKKYSL